MALEHLLLIDTDRNARVYCTCGGTPVKIIEHPTGAVTWRCGTATLSVGL